MAEYRLNLTAEEIEARLNAKMTLGLHTDGLIYLFVDGEPVGNGIALPSGASGDVVGSVESENNIVLMGNLGDGTYSVKYEMEDGSTVNIGNLVLDSNVYYSITKNLTNCTIGNSATSVIEGESYSATITANDGYELSSVVVTMGGANVSVTNGVIDIASVTGNIVIEAVATEKIVTSNYSVTNKLYGCTTNNSAETVTGGNGYSATISAESGYAGHTAVYVTMGGVNVSSTAVNGDKIDIANVTGDIVISCVGYEANKRLNSSGEKTETGYELTAFIPVTWNDTLYMSGVTSNTTASMAGFYSAAVTGTSARYSLTYTHYVFNNADTFINGETVSRKLSTSNLQIIIENKDSIAFVRFSAPDINANSIITVNHPIV